MKEIGKDPRGFLRPTMIRITGILRVAVVICCAATAVSFFGRNWWLFELTTHFRVQYAVALVLAGVLLLALRRFRIAAASMLFALPNVAVIAPIYVPNHSSPTAGSPVKAIFMNLSVTNREYGKAVDLVRSSHPDFLAVAELSPAWLTNLRQHLQDYPHVVSRTRNDQFGIGLFSKTPLERPMIVDLGTLGFPAIKASITSRGRRLTIFVVHPPPPVADLFRDERVTQMQNLAALVVKEKDVVVLGDLNMTPWSPIFRDLLSTTGLEDGRTGFGVQATWPATMPWLLIPVDHCLVSKDLVVRRLAAGSDIGSDHYPVVVEIGLK